MWTVGPVERRLTLLYPVGSPETTFAFYHFASASSSSFYFRLMYYTATLLIIDFRFSSFVCSLSVCSNMLIFSLLYLSRY